MTLTFFLHNQLVALPGFNRALEEWSQIDFTDDRDGCLFTAIVYRPELLSSGKSSGKTDEEIIALLSAKPEMTIPELAEALALSTRAVEKQIPRLREEGRLRRVGPKKGCHWEVVRRKG